jgi:hypothetical protein
MVRCGVCESTRVGEQTWRDSVVILRCMDCGAQCDEEDGIAAAIAEIDAEERALFALDGLMAAWALVPPPVEYPSSGQVAA